MFQAPDYTEIVSMKLSEVLADIGVNTRMVFKRRRAMLLLESISKVDQRLGTKEMVFSHFIFGSQIEGTTTVGIKSDIDRVICCNIFPVIQDLNDRLPGTIPLLMIQDDNVTPGYCKLQILDAPVPMNNCYPPPANFIFTTDSSGRTLFKNTVASFSLNHFAGGIKANGPACSFKGLYSEFDIVLALRCKTWPLQARQWLQQQSIGQWPTDKMKQYCCSSGCFLVGVGSKGSENEELEWRVSTCLAERCLMFNLNITQIRCYVLMKMMIKTFINPFFENVITSYMCKTVLFHCIENTQSTIWRENNLLLSLSLCLHDLYNNILHENCPHFIIPGNNLMRGKISPEAKPIILDKLQYIINSNGEALLEIKCDDLGKRLRLKVNNLCPFRESADISGQVLLHIAKTLQMSSISTYWYKKPIRTLRQNISDLTSLKCHGLDKIACNLLAPRFCTRLGSVLASINIQQYNTISAEALNWISSGLNTDVASSKLKLASMLYCTKQYQRAETVLCAIERHYDINVVQPLCCIYSNDCKSNRQALNSAYDQQIEEAIQSSVAHCVQFWQSEVHCVPKELKQEMFRSTKEEKALRQINDYWMDCAEVDSLPFLYFLQYKIYSNLDIEDKKNTALSKLARTIEREPYLAHGETALNILGQCMEHENRHTQALQCYSLSLNVMRRNNAAKIHICRLLSTLVNSQ